MSVSGMRSASHRENRRHLRVYQNEGNLKNEQKQTQRNQRKFDDKQGRTIQKCQHITPYHYTNRKRNVLPIGDKKEDCLGVRVNDVG